jgi:hypothetical protein
LKQKKQIIFGAVIGAFITFFSLTFTVGDIDDYGWLYLLVGAFIGGLFGKFFLNDSADQHPFFSVPSFVPLLFAGIGASLSWYGSLPFIFKPHLNDGMEVMIYALSLIAGLILIISTGFYYLYKHRRRSRFIFFLGFILLGFLVSIIITWNL